ncbi:G-patch-domain-containing protein [Mytilinidion resinicola]|uniref:G-patch-domain-containing protein n=1 Tax=Mytilinidion resinicola TaxID=574789 RepID=A0A6A6YDI9_9PEZI|nr:G-patch-domain-containing protein [Mytilinidion resinicola]KAF2806593.1 G-patch-domain-containing protein [Mytilinidion resinicola]
MADSDDEDDYMSMAIAEPAQALKETSIQRVARKKREAALKAQVKSKAEKAADEAAAREAALATPLHDTSNKGFKMMAKLGFKHGDTLGADKGGRAEPIQVVLKEDRGGIGLDTEKKRKFREQMNHEAKRVKAEEGEYRERVRFEREELKREGQIRNAQRVAEELASKAKEDSSTQLEPKVTKPTPKNARQPLRSINVLWRGLVRQRLVTDGEKRMRHNLTSVRSFLPTYEDPDLDREDLLALGRDEKAGVFKEEVEDEVEQEDSELDQFNALPSEQRLERLVIYMRQEHRYCFWCKYQYSDEAMSDCPGITEDDHD